MLVIDWGTTNLRAYLCSADGDILEAVSSPRGIKFLAREDYPVVLNELVQSFAGHDIDTVIISGMAGSKNGWLEVPYCEVPTRIGDLKGSLVSLPAQIVGYLVPGIKVVKADDSSDVIRGEEIQIYGAIEHLKVNSALLCLPGTHSKWVRVDKGTIIDFSTFMTGDVFQGLGNTILGCEASDGFCEGAFLQGLSASHEIAGGLLHQLFTGRTKMLDGLLDGSEVSSYVSGLLLGHELSEATHYLTNDETVIVIGSDHLCQRYLLALKENNINALSLSSDIATCRGVAALLKQEE